MFYAAYRLCLTHYWYIDPNVFNAEQMGKIEILGNSIVSNEKIVNTLKGIEIEKKPIYLLNPTVFSNKLEELQPIKRAYIRRFWLPTRFVIMVEEVTPAIIIAPTEDSQAVIAFALTGEMISRDYLPLNKKIKVAKILSYGTQGDDYENWDKEKIVNLYNLALALEKYSGEKLEYIDLRNPHNAYAKLQSVKLKLGQIDVSVFERVKSIHNILPEIQPMLEKVKYVDLSWKDSKYLKME